MLREAELAALPRIGTSPIATKDLLVERLEGIALEIGEVLAERRAKDDPYWWRTADLLDAVMDVLDAARKGVAVPASGTS